MMLAANVFTAKASCLKRELEGELSLPGYESLTVRYSVCVDSTTISPEPSMVRSSLAVFARDCCGCRVSRVTDRELRVESEDSSSDTQIIYVPEIRACECIPCNAETYDWTDYFTKLYH
ncbi:hypothetical protein Bpfe_009566 [Biomphalaria pfeifferi]|uniref:CTCK domain-containing protein n=1 Tax=Biomphalaria pfeifferi TaxID=112525 RepID=A0AAD8FEM2_BIOPF|nr:hypothetical protein Bpfe_009566 [Biomphalaria pfeifferi]